MKEFYTPKELAELLSLNIYTVLKFIKRGELKAMNVGSEKSPTYRITKASLDEFVNNKLKKDVK